ncbi:uncharacterized protein LOC127570090 isoform X2 [Pristis pectinata]|uniref:uncharacterized protein LOC127570090 isoform X2 n=1 Tax=Pristis pectinata TaxID=685728 RepID=UPI00223D927A|nr:uncharacterized protein LOC127570090 isoform X2 [Pristis pectinata]
MLVGLNISLLTFLFQSVMAHESPSNLYFLDDTGDIILNGSDCERHETISWEWKPHSGQQTTRHLGTFYREGEGWKVHWSKEYSNFEYIYNKISQDSNTLSLRITRPEFELAGLFSCRQKEASDKILKQYEVFGIKDQFHSQHRVSGSDITLSCSISRLSDSVSLHWKHGDSILYNRQNFADQIQLNNTLYLIISYVGGKKYYQFMCAVQEDGIVVFTGNRYTYPVRSFIFWDDYTCYRSSTVHSELHLTCSYMYFWRPRPTALFWKSYRSANQARQIASDSGQQHIELNQTHFENRINLTGIYDIFGMFTAHIVPVLFDDAGDYTCTANAVTVQTIKLITVKVTAEPSEAVTEGDNVILICSVSEVTESMRLAWINSDGKTVGEKTLNVEEESLSLIIQTDDRGRGNWRCVLFHQDTPKVVIPYNLEYKDVNL